MKYRVCIKCSSIRASWKDDDVEADTQLAVNAIAVPAVLTAPAAAFAVPAVLTAPAAATAAPEVPTEPAAATTVPALPTTAPPAAIPTTVPAILAAPEVPTTLATAALTTGADDDNLQQAVLLPEEDHHQIFSSGSNNNAVEPETLMECQFSSFQYNSLNNGADEEQAIESFIKQLAQFNQVQSLDINYQGETIHAMFNQEATRIGLIGKGADLSSFHDRKGKVYYITDLSPNHSSSDVMVVVAWKLNSKDTFGLLQTISFEKYVYCLENR
jgi:hypothetical protein